MPYAVLVNARPVRGGVSKAARVYGDLRASIVSLALRPGERLDKNIICQRMNVSRQPVAEAIARLADERLVDVEPQKGTFVARIRMADVLEAAFVRRVLEVAIVAKIADDIDDATLTDLDRNLAYQATALQAEDNEGFYALDLRFHTMLIEQAAMRRVGAAVESSRAPLERARRLLLLSPGRSGATLREHRAILAALKARNPDVAGAAMAAHLDKVMAEIRRFAARQSDLFEP
ncbi:MAG: GntR family transcriptional regulator [Bauldia sp.]